MRRFRHFLISPVTFFFCSIFILTALAQEKLPQIVKKIEPSIVVILTYGKDGKMIGQGSGFFISQSGDMFTNRHVLTGVHRAEVGKQPGEKFTLSRGSSPRIRRLISSGIGKYPKKLVHPLSVSQSLFLRLASELR